MRELADKVQRMDDEQLIIEYKSVSPFSANDEFIQLLLKEIVKRKINIDHVLNQLHLQPYPEAAARTGAEPFRK